MPRMNGRPAASMQAHKIDVAAQVLGLLRALMFLCIGGSVVGLSYADAVLLMGGRNSRTIAALDRLTGGLLLAASAAGGGFALSLFDAKSELAQLNDQLIRELGQRLRGLNRFTRSERLAAAHSVLALTAYFEVLAGTDLPFEARELELTKAEQAALAGGGTPRSSRLRALAAGLLQAEVPIPAPQRPYEATLEAMLGFYRDLSAELSRFVSGLAVWDRLDETQRMHFAEVVSFELPSQAVARYEERFRQLALEFPELAFWSNLVDHQATRAEVRRLGTGMVGLERMLNRIAAGAVPDDRRLGLSRTYRSVLQRPVLTTGDAPQGLRLPLLGDAYVNPDFRVVGAAGLAERFTEESWWDEQPVRDDLEGFLFGHLTAPQAVEAPLLVLGQPGSGKSVLTQVLAARLPPEQFLVVRVVLRDAGADADVQTQIEDAVRSATGESLAWADLVRSTPDALPVVILDGFDELLQATGVSHTDYLRKVKAFQAREADQSRPVAVLVTSRTAVADRAQPAPGVIVVRLEPFSEAQISRWLCVWNDANTTALEARGLRPLMPQTVLGHAELAAQPLLLLMLALYDADGNPLQRADATLDEAELYERLLVSFAEREIRKSNANLSDRQFRGAVEQELLRLSLVAFAMFSRGRQWVSDAELDADLPTLLDVSASHAAPVGLRAPLSAAEVVIGRFFFVYEAQATRDSTLLHTYEFLHATFGEYLIARLVTRELSDLADAAQFAAGRTRPEPIDDAFLHALLSYMPLTMRGTIMSFVTERFHALPEPQRQQLRTVLIRLFADAFAPRHDTRYNDYTPQTLPVPARYAAYSANLAVLAVLAAGEVTGRSLFPMARDPVGEWRKLALLWRSQLPREGWAGLIGAIALDRIWENDQREMVLRRDERTGQPSGRTDPHWSYNRGPSHEYRQVGRPFGWMLVNDVWLRNQAWFLCDDSDDALAHALEPFAGDFNAVISGFHSYWPDQGRAVSAANALITLWLASSSDCALRDLIGAYDTCLEMAIRAKFSPNESRTRERFRILVLRKIASDQRLPEEWLDSAIIRIQDAATKTSAGLFEAAALLRIANEIFPERMASRFQDSGWQPGRPATPEN